jgi:hypothetical protein
VNFQQLRSVRETVRQGFNLTEVAFVLHTVVLTLPRLAGFPLVYGEFGGESVRDLAMPHET